MIYAIIIVLATSLTALVNIMLNRILFNLEVWYIIFASISSTIAVIMIDSIFATIIRRAMPNKWFSHERKIFNVSKKEIKFYQKIGIRKWKDKVIELGMFTGFRKNKLIDPRNNEYISRFLLESNYGIVIHLVSVFVGYSIILIFPFKYALCFGVPIATVNAVLNLLPTFILRYNIPKLKALHKQNEKRANKTNEINLNEENKPD